ncbi:hypothetical protein R3P38DRAFT_2544795, partial [Favolaschia claudopus]
VRADGAFGLVRPMLLNEQGIQEATKPTMCMYSATVPKALVEKDPQSKHFYEHEVISMFSFFGNNQSAISRPTGGLPCFTFTLYRPYDEYESTPAEGMRAALPKTGSTQQYAMELEDGAVLAKLFSHLATDSQITDFLYAFQELRQPRAQTVLKIDVTPIRHVVM